MSRIEVSQDAQNHISVEPLLIAGLVEADFGKYYWTDKAERLFEIIWLEHLQVIRKSMKEKDNSE